MYSNSALCRHCKVYVTLSVVICYYSEEYVQFNILIVADCSAILLFSSRPCCLEWLVRGRAIRL